MAPIPNRSIQNTIPSKSTLARIDRPIKKKCLIKINNDDKNSLFLALQATLVYATGKLTDQRFYDYRNSIGPRMNGRLHREMMELKKAVGAPEQDEAYDVELWVPRVIDHWNNKTVEQKFHAFVFKPNCVKSIYKYGPEQYDIPIILYYDEARQHFDGVQKAGHLFGLPYCLACEMYYRTPSDHTKKCQALCINCLRMKQGQPPCPAIPEYNKKCNDCSKTFFNDTCYAYHKEKNICTWSKQCEKCGAVMDLKRHRRDKNTHVCRKSKILS